MYNDDRIAHWSIFLNEVKTLSFPKKKIFISYAWDGDAIETDWLHMRLKRIRDDLITLGIEEVFLDISHMNGDITITMQEKLATPDLIVLVICTPLYVQRINDLVRNPNNVRYEYLAILKKLEYQPHSVYPLQLAGTFGSAVPEALRNPTIQGCQLLVRDFRDPLQHEAQMGQLDNGLGLIPGIVGLRLDTPLGKDYHAKWQYFAHAYWGDADHPSHLLRKLENKSRQLQKEENIVETKAYYIPNDVSRTRDGTRTSNLTQLWQHVGQQAATTNGRVFLLFGESGVGKSTALMHYESQLWENIATEHLVPIRIPLHSVDREPKDFVTHWLLQCGYNLEKELPALKHHYRLVLLLDGYDELVFKQGVRNLLADSHLDLWPGSIVISCRTQLEVECRLFIEHYAQYPLLSVERYYLCSFTAAQVDHYLAEKAKKDVQLTPDVRARFHTLPGLFELIVNPVLLYIISDLLPELVSQGVQALTRYRVYELFTDKWFEREFVRIIGNGALAHLNLRGKPLEQWQERLVHYAQKIAVCMFQEQTVTLSQTVLTAEERKFLDVVLSQEAADKAVDVLRNACPLKVFGQTDYQFMHKSFQEFLVAQAFLQELPLITYTTKDIASTEGARADRHDEAYRHKSLQLENSVWNKVELRREPEVLKFLSDTKPNQYLLLQIICESKGVLIEQKYFFSKNEMVYPGNPYVAQAAGNALTLYIYCGYSASGLNFNHTYLTKANINNGLFRQTKVEHAQWTDTLALQSLWQQASIQKSRWDVKHDIVCRGDSAVYSLAISPINHTEVAVSYSNGHITMWDIAQQRQLWNADWVDSKNTLAYTPDGKQLMSFSCDEMRVCNSSTGACLRIFKMNIGTVLIVQGNTMLSAFRDNTLVWDVNNGMQQPTLMKKEHTKLLGSPIWRLMKDLKRDTDLQGTTLVPDSSDKMLRMWEIVTGKHLEREKVSFATHDYWYVRYHQAASSAMEAINCVAFSGNTGVAGYYDKILRVWELSTGVCKYKLWGHTKAVECVAIQDNIVLSGSLDNSVRVWDSSTGACLHVLVGHATPIRCVAIKGNTIISGSEDGELRIWDISTGIPISNDTVSCLAVTGNTVVVAYSGSLDKILHIWDISTGLCVRTLVGHTAEVLCITVTDKANIIVSSSSDNTLRVWDVSTGACLYILVGHTSPISSVAVVGNIVLSQGQSWDKTPLRIWELSTGVCLHALAHTKDVECVALAENAVISSNGNGLKIWDVKTGQSSHMLVDLDQSYIICIAAKTNMLVSGSARDKRLRVWDMATGVCLRKLGNYFDKFGTPMKIQFHPNPHWVVVFYDSGLLALWDIMQDTLLDKQQWPIVNTDEQHTITHSTKPHKYGRILYPISAAWNINKGYLVLRTSTGGVMCAQIPPTQYYNPDIPRLPPWQLAWTRPAPHLDVRDLQIDGAEIVDASTQALLQRGTRGKPR